MFAECQQTTVRGQLVNIVAHLDGTMSFLHKHWLRPKQSLKWVVNIGLTFIQCAETQMLMFAMCKYNNLRANMLAITTTKKAKCPQVAN